MNKKELDILDRSVEEIRQYFKDKSRSQMPAWMVEYLDWMEYARDWFYQFKSRRFVVNHLMAYVKQKDGMPISRYIAEKVFADAMNFFYLNTSIRKQSLRNMLIEKAELAALALYASHEYDKFGKMVDRIARLQELDKPEDGGVDPRLLDRRPIVYVVRPEDIGVLPTNKNELARLIDSYDIREGERTRVKREAGILPRRLFENAEDAKIVEEPDELDQ